ncbi:MAG: hypothetical protein HDR80_04320 [Bacteroides sp.]|nr:hypothetical protein [Bacteroides sp.]
MATSNDTITQALQDGYVNGSDILLLIGTKAIGHCTTHTLNLNTETKDRAVKPAASKPKTKALFKDKGVTGLSYDLSADGMVFIDEEEFGWSDLVEAWHAAEPVTAVCKERGAKGKIYLQGACVITNASLTSPAQDDATFSISLENTGAPEKINEAAAS